MKLESLKSEKFSQNILKRNQMFMLNGGGGTKTSGGTGYVRYDNSGRCYTCDYGYDIDRGNGLITRHQLTNKKLCNPCE